jgi:hypothetical protein
MSQTPSTNAPTYLQIDPDPGNIILGTANLPSSLTVSSAMNGGGYHDAIVQATASKQPGWSANAIAGQFLYQDYPGASGYPVTSAAGTKTLVGVPGFLFTGTQFFEYDSLAATFAGTGVGITVTCVFQSTSTAGTQTIWGLGAAGATPYLQLQLNGSALKMIDSNGTTTAQVASIANVGTDPVGLPTLQTATGTIASPAAAAYTTFCIGALNVSAAQTNFFNGAIGKLAVYGVQAGTTVADVEEVEAEFMLACGLSRTQDLATSAASGTLEA